MSITSTRDSGTIRSVTSVMEMLMENIMTSTPTMVVREATIWVMLWFRDWLTVSTSLVMRESTSPWLTRSKYFSGMRLIFSEISLRKR